MCNDFIFLFLLLNYNYVFNEWFYKIGELNFSILKIAVLI